MILNGNTVWYLNDFNRLWINPLTPHYHSPHPHQGKEKSSAIVSQWVKERERPKILIALRGKYELRPAVKKCV
jgi:hypothetical protein